MWQQRVLKNRLLPAWWMTATIWSKPFLDKGVTLLQGDIPVDMDWGLMPEEEWLSLVAITVIGLLVTAFSGTIAMQRAHAVKPRPKNMLGSMQQEQPDLMHELALDNDSCTLSAEQPNGNPIAQKRKQRERIFCFLFAAPVLLLLAEQWAYPLLQSVLPLEAAMLVVICMAGVGSACLFQKYGEYRQVSIEAAPQSNSEMLQAKQPSREKWLFFPLVLLLGTMLMLSLEAAAESESASLVAAGTVSGVLLLGAGLRESRASKTKILS